MKCHKPPKMTPMIPMIPMIPMMLMMLRQQSSRTHGASRPGDTIRNGNNGGAWRNSRNGRNVGADVILTGVGLLPALAHGFQALRL